MERGNELLVIDREKEKLKPPPKYAVVMHNDDFTPMDFVVDMLVVHFHHSGEVAARIMWDVHTKGKGVAGVFSKDIAETKVAMAMAEAKSQEHPFLLTVEPE